MIKKPRNERYRTRSESTKNQLPTPNSRGEVLVFAKPAKMAWKNNKNVTFPLLTSFLDSVVFD